MKKYIGMFFRLAVAVVLLWWVIRGMNFSGMRELSWKGICCSYVGSLLLISIQTALTAYRWQMLLGGQGIQLTLFRTLSLTFQGAMFSLFMPGGALGGDVLKAAFLTRETEKGTAVEGITTILLDRLLGMLGLFGLVILVLLFSLPQILQFSGEIRFLIFVLGSICLIGFTGGVVLLYQDVVFRVPLFAYLLRKADPIAKGGLTRVLKSVETCRRNRKTLWKAFLLTFLIIHPMLAGCGVLILCGITGQFYVQATCTAVLLGNVASTAPVSPGGLGTRDKVTEVVLRAFHIDNSIASLVPLLYSCAYVTVGLFGVLFFLGDSFYKKKTELKE